MNTGKTIGGMGAAALTALAAYWLYEKRKRATSPAARGWMLKMKGDVAEKLEDLKELNRDAYHKIVDQVAEHYGNVKKAGREELKALVRDLKEDWDEFSRKVLAGKN